jgi:peptidoglycan/LPS O-acetylase OafA/YrhL
MHDRHPAILQHIGWDLSTHLLMVHNLTDQYAGGLGNGAFWSLGMEEQLYALYFILLILLRRHYKVIVPVVVMTVGWRLLLPLLDNSPVRIGSLQLGSWGQWPFGYWMHWALGAIAVDAFFGNRPLPAWTESGKWTCACLFAGMAFNHTTFDLLNSTSLRSLRPTNLPGSIVHSVHTLGELVAAVGCFCLMRWAIKHEDTQMLDGHLAGWFCQLGKVSYSVYLIHVPVIYVLATYTSIGNTGLAWAGRSLLFTGASITAGFLFYYAIERWFLDGRCPTFRLNAMARAQTGNQS